MTTQYTSSYGTFTVPANTWTWSGSTTTVGTGAGISWTAPITLTETEVKQLQELLKLATHDADELAELAGSLAAHTGLTESEALAGLKLLQGLLQLSSLMEKLQR